MAVPITSTDGTVHWNNSEVDQARGWTINPSSEAKTYTTNKTNGKVNRRPGNIDVTGTFNVYSTGTSIVAFPGQIANLKLYINASNYWNLDKCMIESFEWICDVETNDIEGVTYNWSFSGDADGTGGTITDPAGTSYTSASLGEIAEG